MADDVVIKISGDNSQYKTSLTDAEQSTKQFNDSLQTIGIAAGVAFGALVGGVYKSVEAYNEGQKSAMALNVALQNQGIYSEELVEKYNAISDSIKKKTGIDDDDVKGMLASVQAMIGQKEITEDMASAIVDLSAARNIDLKSAGDMVAKGINGQIGALEKLGLHIDDHISKEERTAQIFDQLKGKNEGFAEALYNASGKSAGLSNAVGDLGKALGKEFSPLIKEGTELLTNFINWIAENKELVAFSAKIIAAGIAITGLVAGIAAAITIFGQIGAAIGIVTTAIAGMSAGVGLLVGATGLGALLVIGGLIFSDWKEIFPTMEAIFEAFVDNISALGGAIGTMLQGIFSLDSEQIEQGYEDAKEVIENGLVEFQMIKDTKMAEDYAKETKFQGSQIESRKIHADKMQAESDKRNAEELAAVQKKNDDKLAKEEAAHVSFLFQKIKAGGELSQADIDKYGLDEENIEKHFQELQGLTDTQDSTLLNKLKEANSTEITELNTHLENKKEINKDYDTEETGLITAHKNEVAQINKNNLATIETDISTSKSNIVQSYKEHYSELNNQLTTYASQSLQKMNSFVSSGNSIITKDAFDTIERETDSHYSSMKIKSTDYYSTELSKATTWVNDMITQFNKLSTNTTTTTTTAPRQVAGGGLQRIEGFASGGLITGGITGIDSVPVMAQGGELVAPVRSFEEVIGSVRAYREAQNMGMSGIGGQSSIVIGFDGREASQVLTARQIEDRALGLTQEVTV